MVSDGLFVGGTAIGVKMRGVIGVIGVIGVSVALGALLLDLVYDIGTGGMIGVNFNVGAFVSAYEIIGLMTGVIGVSTGAMTGFNETGSVTDMGASMDGTITDLGDIGYMIDFGGNIG